MTTYFERQKVIYTPYRLHYPLARFIVTTILASKGSSRCASRKIPGWVVLPYVPFGDLRDVQLMLPFHTKINIRNC